MQTKYVKVPVTLVNDHRFRDLHLKHGIKGLSILLHFVLCLEHLHGHEVPVTMLLNCRNPSMGRKYCVDILRNYGFFEIDKDDFVVAYNLGATEEWKVRVCERVPARVPVRVPVRVPEHIIEDTDNIIIKEGREETTTTTAASQINEVDEVREWLINSERTLWREQLLMKCGFGDLLASRWSEAVEEFLKHLVAFCRLDRCYNEQVARSYFATFCIAETPARSCLIKHLHSLHSEASGPATTAGLEEICETKATVISNVNERPE